MKLPNLSPLQAIAVTLVAVTVVSHLAPTGWTSTLVALVFLGATYFLCLRDNAAEPPENFGLAFAGLLEPGALSPRRIARDFLSALLWALALSVVFLPPFLVAFPLWYGATNAFSWERAAENFGAQSSALDLILGQVLVVALPEEAFFRGYAQTTLGKRFAMKWNILGASIGPEVLVTSALFAVGHVLTIPEPGRLAVFFPSLVFGWLRARTGGVGAALLFHAISNLFSAFLTAGYLQH